MLTCGRSAYMFEYKASLQQNAHEIKCTVTFLDINQYLGLHCAQPHEPVAEQTDITTWYLIGQQSITFHYLYCHVLTVRLLPLT